MGWKTSCFVEINNAKATDNKKMHGKTAQLFEPIIHLKIISNLHVHDVLISRNQLVAHLNRGLETDIRFLR